jgi:hypothetical protein
MLNGWPSITIIKLRRSNMEMELTATFKAIIINGRICIAINKEDWTVDDVGDLYIICPDIKTK